MPCERKCAYAIIALMAEGGTRGRGAERSALPGGNIVACWSALGISQVGPVCLVVWRDKVTPERFELQRTALRSLAAKHAQPVALMCVVQPSSPPPDAAMRRASIAMVDELGSRLSCVACVIEGGGLIAATTRSVLSGMALLINKTSVPIKFTGTISVAADWIAVHCSSASAPDLLSAYVTLSSRMPPMR
jgi:hypothetical protein